MSRFIVLFCLCVISSSLMAQKVVNVYIWGGIIPASVIHQFEQESGIIVNVSTYDSNETMYAKLKSSKRSIYDVILPSSYFVERMRKQSMLSELNPEKLTNLVNLDALFRENDYDPGNHFSVPIIWGTTGMFYNAKHIKNPPTFWGDLWSNRWSGQLMLLDDAREVFSAALLRLGYSPNDTNPKHLLAAYQTLRALIPNIKLFASDSIQATIIDEDALAGLAWNGDAFKAQMENSNIHFVYPKNGFVIWVDCLAIPRNPPHPDEAYLFINYLLKANIAAEIALKEGHAITNTAGKQLLPPEIRDNPVVYPDTETLKRGVFQRDVGEETIVLYNQYWEALKLMF